VFVEADDSICKLSESLGLEVTCTGRGHAIEFVLLSSSSRVNNASCNRFSTDGFNEAAAAGADDDDKGAVGGAVMVGVKWNKAFLIRPFDNVVVEDDDGDSPKDGEL